MVGLNIVPNKQGNKLPDFKVPNYHGEHLNGNKCIRLVEYTFHLCAITRFLTSDSACKKQMEYSSVFANQIRNLISHSSVLSFMSPESMRLIVVWHERE